MAEIGVLTHPFEALFDAVPDTVFFMKDAEGRYTSVNQTLVQRLGRRSKTELIGCTACDVFPAPLGARILAQDRQIAAGGRPLHSVLELHLYPGGAEGWCLTWKEPVRDAAGRIAGLAGLSRDLQIRAEGTSEFTGISAALAHIRDHLDGSLKLGDVARQAGLSDWQFDQRLRSLFGVSAAQYITRARIDLALSRLRGTTDPISQIALDCGYADQTSFTRQFRKSVGLTPHAYRAQFSRA
jgi:PAS domain S-box-containing protein